MRLINTKTGEFEEFFDSSTTPLYAILSHTWDPPPMGEQSYQDVVEIQEKYRSPPHLDGEVLSNLGPGDTSGVVPQTEGLSASERYTPSPSTPSPCFLSTTPEPHLSPSLSALLRSLLITILARAALYLLLGSSVLSHLPVAECRTEAQTSPSPPRRSIWDSDSGLSEKVRKACEIARRDGYHYIWIDSSCIDKTSSSELSEAINSMFKWYRDAQICYAFLADVPSDDDLRAVNLFGFFTVVNGQVPVEDSNFRKSRWFKRLWTLQELIAPRTVIFLSKDWKVLGTKESLADLIEEITLIDRDVLTQKKALADESVAERMRWAAKREATRVEDEAYSLLGIFGITMPTLYGEGRQAFQRLQEEILQRIPDQSLFTWGGTFFSCIPTGSLTSLASNVARNASGRTQKPMSPFARSPKSFAYSKFADPVVGKVVRGCGPDFESLQLPLHEYTPTPYGIRTKLCLLSLPIQHHDVMDATLTHPGFEGEGAFYLAIFGCQSSLMQGWVLSKLCYVGRGRSASTAEPESLQYVMGQETSLLSVSVEDLIHTTRTSTGWPEAPWIFEHYCPSEQFINSHSFTLSNARLRIHFHYRLSRWGEAIRESEAYSDVSIALAVVIEARIWILPPGSSDEEVQQSDTIVQRMPPYTSEIWRDRAPWDITLPSRRIHLRVEHSGPTGSDSDSVILQLGLEIAASSHYRILVEVATGDGSASTSTSDNLPTTDSVPKPPYAPKGLIPMTPMPPDDEDSVKLTMLGSVRQALEGRGYSVQLEDSDTVNGIVYSLSLSNSESGFTISIKYSNIVRSTRQLEMRRHQDCGIIAAARVTLESSSAPYKRSEMLRDGPYVVVWANFDFRVRWEQLSEVRGQVTLATPAGQSLTLSLGLVLAWHCEYYLLADITNDGDSLPRGEHQPDVHRPRGPRGILYEPHTGITLTLPGHVRLALRGQGFHHVDFEGPNEDHPDYSLLALSNAHIAIAIEYSHHLSSGSDGKQGLTFHACVKALFSRGPEDHTTPTTQPVDQSIDWDASQPEIHDERGWVKQVGGWQWNLPQKDVKLAMPTGLELTLRLSFYLVWLGEYCLTVEVNPPPPPPPPPPRPAESLGMLETFHPGKDGAEEAGGHDDGGRHEMVPGEADDQESTHSSIAEIEAPPFWGVGDGEVWGEGDHAESPATPPAVDSGSVNLGLRVLCSPRLMFP